MPKTTKRTTRVSSYRKFDMEDAVSAVVLAPAVGALVVGVSGTAGKSAVSFFNPAMAHAVGGFSSFAATGALGYALYAFPGMLLKYCANAEKNRENSFTRSHPKTMRALHNTADLLLRVGGIAAAAAIMGSPIGATVICAMVIPVAIHLLMLTYTLLKSIVTSLKSCMNSSTSIVASAPKVDDPKKDGFVARPTIAAAPRPGSIFSPTPTRSEDSKRSPGADLWETAYISF